MNKAFKTFAVAALLSASCFAHANLVVNGGFEASTDPTSTPPGWTNIGHSDGVIAYSAFNTPGYQGLYFYDLGGFGNANGPTGDGIAQTFATTMGLIYSVTFGLSSENAQGNQELTVTAGSAVQTYALDISADGTFMKPFTTQTFNFVATGASTTLSFIQTIGGGSNDAMIDGVIVDLVEASNDVPEPASLALVGLGLAGIAAARRRKQA